MTDSILQSRIKQPLESFVRLSPDQRSGIIRAAVSDLNAFLDDGRALDQREAPARTRELAQSLFAALENIADDSPAARSGARAATLAERLVTEAFVREEADRDQNVYLGKLFTRTLTRAIPDLIFQPVSVAEAAASLRWARLNQVPVTLRGAASTAMGGAVPNDGGLTLDLSRLDSIDIEAGNGVAVVGAGTRLRTLHQKLGERGLALRAYPSNLGGTLAGWFVTGGIGMNAFGRGRALDSVRSADLVLPGGEHLRFHDDGRLDVPGEGHHRHTLSKEESAGWFSAHGLEPITLADLAGSEGVFGMLTHLTVSVEPRPEIGAFLIAFPLPMGAFEAARWVAGVSGTRFGAPANVKAMSASHLHHLREVWKDEDSRDWRQRGSRLSDGATLPWRRIASPNELGAATGADSAQAGSYLFVDFFDLDAARVFATAIGEMPGSPRALEKESVRFAAERFRPQQIKRLGPGMLAAEIVLPLDQVVRFIPKAARLASNAGNDLDAEVYVLADGTALVIAGYLTDHRRGSFAVDLMIAPALVDLAMRSHRGRPYVLGRWQSAWARKRFGGKEVSRLARVKRGVDSADLVNRGVLLRFRLHGPLGGLVQATFAPGVGLLSRVYGSTILSPLVRIARAILSGFPGPARGRGEPAKVGAKFAASSATGGLMEADGHVMAVTQVAAARALNCVNCGECNSVCPIFNESKIRLPQMLTHVGEGAYAGKGVSPIGSVLLDLCMRCGNCEEVCQAGIPHLPLYEQLQTLSDDRRPPDKERHTAIVAAVRSSSHYLRDFLDVRPGGYVKRAPASLPGVARYMLMRAENDAGPAATCIHCGACVAVCPTQANREYEGADPRWITTAQERCVGCGTCVEVCPANQANGGQTLRVMEAPTRDWFIALEEFERGAAK
ncbi:MAG TPA: FAD-binding protein [Candidatus Sulfotelmatobacter sp.]|nr:FAD-binding protein [Candidatus Sulfotelmatobacter sp.]